MKNGFFYIKADSILSLKKCHYLYFYNLLELKKNQHLSETQICKFPPTSINKDVISDCTLPNLNL